jgi:HAE1 family hydrophobic/amphiphilic exporter-1
VSNYKRGQSISEAALGAARLRFRPIVMTAFAFIFGCLPLWTATGSGAVSRRILGTVVIGGMTLATILGILMVPVTFAVVEYVSHRLGKGGKGTTMDSKHDPEDDTKLHAAGVTSQQQEGHA